MAAKVSHLQLLSQTLTNYSPFPSGEEHPILQTLTWSTPGKPREVWPPQGLQDGSEDLAKGPVSFALASHPAAHPYHASTSRNPEHIPPKSCLQCAHHSRASSGNLSGGAEHLSQRSPLMLGCSHPRCLISTQERWHLTGLALHFQGERLMLFSYQLLYYTISKGVVFVLLPHGI